MDDNKPKTVRGNRSKPQTSLKVQPKAPYAHLFTQIRTSPFYTESNGQRAIVLAQCQNGDSKIWTNQKSKSEFYESGRGILTQAIEQYRGTALPKLYDMITDKLYESHFKEKTLKFRASELSRLTGNRENHADRIKKRFVEAAHILYEFSFTTKTPEKRIDFRMIQEVQETRGGFVILMTDRAMELFERMPKVQHDTVLYRLKDQNECTYSLGRWIEDYSVRHSKKDENSLKEVTFTVKAIMGGCSFIPDYLSDSREYAHRRPWLENQLNALKEVGFMDWEWVDGRPASLEQEATKQIRCRFTNERIPIGTATTFDEQTKKRKSLGK